MELNFFNDNPCLNETMTQIFSVAILMFNKENKCITQIDYESELSLFLDNVFANAIQKMHEKQKRNEPIKTIPIKQEKKKLNSKKSCSSNNIEVMNNVISIQKATSKL
jgi:hypothetical protein